MSLSRLGAESLHRRGIFTDLFHVSAHCLASLRGIAPFDCLEDQLVMNLPSRWSTRDGEHPQALLAENAHNRIKQRKNEWIAGGFCQCEVKVEIRLYVGLGIVHAAIHNIDGLTHHR